MIAPFFIDSIFFRDAILIARRSVAFIVDGGARLIGLHRSSCVQQRGELIVERGARSIRGSGAQGKDPSRWEDVPRKAFRSTRHG